jgi:hypothetical protein
MLNFGVEVDEGLDEAVEVLNALLVSFNLI